MTDLITTDLTPIPSRQTPSTFSTDADTLLGKLPAWSSEANALATGANTNAIAAAQSVVDAAAKVVLAADEVDLAEAQVVLAEAQVALATAQVTLATAQADTSAANANFNGNWSDQTGAAAIPYSVLHNTVNYQLIAGLADVTTIEPGVTGVWETYWAVISSGVSDFDGGASTTVYSSADIILESGGSI